MMSAKRVLVVKLNKLGDAAAFIPTIHAMRGVFRGAHITMLTTPIARDLLAGERIVDEFFISTIDGPKTLSGFFRILMEVRRGRFDCAVASSDTSSYMALLLFLAGIKIRIGFSDARLAFLYTAQVPYDPARSHAELNYAIMPALGYDGPMKNAMTPFSPEEESSAKRLLYSVGLEDGARYAVMHLGSCSLSDRQRWPAEYFCAVIKHLMTYHMMRTLLIGAPGEYTSGRAVLMNMDGVIDLAGKTTVRELSALIAGADLFVGHPSGPLQIAYLMGTPSISLWGASSFTEWGPVFAKEKHRIMRAPLDCLGCEAEICPKGTYDCMSLIGPAPVIEAIDAQLGGHR